MHFRKRGEKNSNWAETTNDWKEEQKCKFITLPSGKKEKFTGQLGDCCEFHRWQLFGPILRTENRGKIITSPAAEEFLKNNGHRRGPTGELVVSTARGKRRVQKRERKK